MPATGGPLRIGNRSLDSEFSQFRPGIADSLWPIFEIFPFSGDCGRRGGFDLHCVAEPALPLPSGNCKCPAHIAAPCSAKSCHNTLAWRSSGIRGPTVIE